jgi:hypothetical protein
MFATFVSHYPPLSFKVRRVASRIKPAPANDIHLSGAHNLKPISILPRTLTGLPSFIAGSKRIARAASMAFSVNPQGNPLN